MSRPIITPVDNGRYQDPPRRNNVNHSHDHYAHHETHQNHHERTNFDKKRQDIRYRHQEEYPEAYSEEVHTSMFIPKEQLWSEEETKEYLKDLYNNKQTIHYAKINELRKKQHKKPYENKYKIKHIDENNEFWDSIERDKYILHGQEETGNFFIELERRKKRVPSDEERFQDAEEDHVPSEDEINNFKYLLPFMIYHAHHMHQPEQEY